MQVLEGLSALPAAFRDAGCVATVGVFDGVHLGHFHVLRRVVQRAQSTAHKSVMVTFAGHPKQVLLGQAPATVTSLEHRLLLFRRAGIDATLVLEFDDDLRELSAEDFVRNILVEGLGLRELVFGFDSKFGKDRGGNAESMRSLADELGFLVSEVPALRVDGRAVSSTAIREAVGLGDLRQAGQMLGRPTSLLGTVVRGDGRGRELGFPTANLELHHELQPPPGVYATLVRRPGHRPMRLWPAVANLGQRPTFDQAGPSVEVHLLDFSEDLYGQELEVFFLARLREEREFASPNALRRHIEEDVQSARKAISEAEEEWLIPGPFMPVESREARRILGMEEA